MRHILAPSLLVALLISGCAVQTSQPTGAVQLSSLRASPPVNGRELVVALSKDELDRALTNQASRSFRLVQIFSGTAGAAGTLPEYRMFGIKPGSAFDMMGLKNGDILVAANDYVVYQPVAFVQYVAIMRHQPDPFIEIRRGNAPIVLRYKLS